MGYTTGQRPMKPISTDEIVVLIDGRCIRCDQEEHRTKHCHVTGDQWKQSTRYQLLKGLGLDAIVHAVRRDRALITLGRSRNEY